MRSTERLERCAGCGRSTARWLNHFCPACEEHHDTLHCAENRSGEPKDRATIDREYRAAGMVAAAERLAVRLTMAGYWAGCHALPDTSEPLSRRTYRECCAPVAVRQETLRWEVVCVGHRSGRADQVLDAGQQYVKVERLDQEAVAAVPLLVRLRPLD